MPSPRLLLRVLPAVLTLFVLTVVPAASAQEAPPSTDELLQQAVRLHDAGDYAAAIAIYKRVLAVDPANDVAHYELTYSTYASGDLAGAATLATAGSKKVGKFQPIYYEILGNTLDGLHRGREAVDAYKRGIRLNPNLPTLHFNLAVAYMGMGKVREARLALERAIEINGNYASAHFVLAELYRTNDYRIPAVLAYGRFLSLSPAGERAKHAATQLRALLTSSVTREDATNITLTIPTNAKKDLGDFGTLEVMMALAGGAEHLPEKAAASEFERQSESYATFVAMLTESADQIGRGFVKKVYVPFYVRMSEQKQTPTFVRLALAPLNAPGASEWVAAHESDIAQFVAWAKK